MHATEDQIGATIRALRDCFHKLKAFGDTLHADLGVNASMRGVLECLGEEGPMTVPQIARLKGVSRQHIQLVANGLGEKGCIIVRPNPNDARSPLLEITKEGRVPLKTVLKREATILSALASQFSASDIVTTGRTLDSFQKVLLGLSIPAFKSRS